MPVLGIDTSCYTTSIAVVDGLRVLADSRLLLQVPEGGRGLQQSKAFFQHIHNLDTLICGLNPALRNRIDALVVSARPRPAEESYMPVFTAGTSVAHSIASMLGKPCFETTHQEGHIAAGFHSLGLWPRQPLLAFHVSGGTTEILHIQPAETGFQIEKLGGTQDLHAGQFVDRVGVSLGLAFPAGPALERLAAGYAGGGTIAINAHVDGMQCSLSGAESAAQRFIQSGADRAEVAFQTLACLADVFCKVAKNAISHTGIRDIMVIGGVASNAFIREQMKRFLAGVNVMFAVNPFSSDNAVGVAYIGTKNFHRGESDGCNNT